jgi:threonine synthase
LRTPEMPMVVLETALPAKFEETMSKHWAANPSGQPACEGIEDLPQRVEVIDVSVDAVKQFIKDHVC